MFRSVIFKSAPRRAVMRKGGSKERIVRWQDRETCQARSTALMDAVLRGFSFPIFVLGAVRVSDPPVVLCVR